MWNSISYLLYVKFCSNQVLTDIFTPQFFQIYKSKRRFILQDTVDIQFGNWLRQSGLKIYSFYRCCEKNCEEIDPAIFFLTFEYIQHKIILTFCARVSRMLIYL